MSISTAHTFSVKFRDVDGEVIERDFTFNMPTLRTRREIGILEAKMRKGVPADSLDDLTRTLISQIAFLTLTVETPEGVSFDDQVDPLLLNKVFEEVLSFENTFLDARLISEETV